MKTALSQTIQLRIRTQFSSIWHIDRTLSGATTPGKSGPGNDGNKGIIRIYQSSHITEASPPNSLVSYPGHLLKESCISAEMQSMYSTALADRAQWWNSSIWPIDATLTGTHTPLDLGVQAMKSYSAFPKTLEVEPHYQILFSVASRTLVVRVNSVG